VAAELPLKKNLFFSILWLQHEDALELSGPWM